MIKKQTMQEKLFTFDISYFTKKEMILCFQERKDLLKLISKCKITKTSI